MPGEHDQDFLDEIAGFGAEDARTPAELEEQGQIEDELEAEAKAEKPDPDEYDERDEHSAGHRPDAQAEPTREEPPRQVPVAELVAERKRRQELERRLQELEAAEAAKKQAQQQPEQKAEQPPEDPEPDYLDDPKAWTDWRIRQQAREIEALKQKSAQVEQQTAEQRQVQEFFGKLQADEQAFASENADYYDALNFARQKVARDILASAEALGIEVTQEQLIAELKRQEIMTAANAMQRGMRPSEVVYKIAKAFGYQKAPAPNGAVGRPVPSAASRAVARGLPAGDAGNDLTESEDDGSIPSEFLAARAERFGRAR